MLVTRTKERDRAEDGGRKELRGSKDVLAIPRHLEDGGNTYNIA